MRGPRPGDGGGVWSRRDRHCTTAARPAAVPAVGNLVTVVSDSPIQGSPVRGDPVAASAVPASAIRGSPVRRRPVPAGTVGPAAARPRSYRRPGYHFCLDRGLPCRCLGRGRTGRFRRHGLTRRYRGRGLTRGCLGRGRARLAAHSRNGPASSGLAVVTPRSARPLDGRRLRTAGRRRVPCPPPSARAE